MTVLTPEDRLALEKACEARIDELSRRLVALEEAYGLDDFNESKETSDERARVEYLRRYLATGERMEIP